ncbi:MAG: methyltransferase domain-containing protein [Saprospiraceae bacterium]
MSDSENEKLFRDLISKKEIVRIEIGCGPLKREPDLIGIDMLKLPGVDIVHNLEEGLPFIPDNSVDEISSFHVLEHLVSFEKLMRDIHRILKKNGIHKATVPHFSNPHYYSDYTHKRFFGLYTFDYFTPRAQQSLHRKVPDFYNDFHFKVLTRKYSFKRHLSPRNILNIIFASPFFNLSDFTKELYEDKFCYMFPCQELYYEMKPIK